MNIDRKAMHDLIDQQMRNYTTQGFSVNSIHPRSVTEILAMAISNAVAEAVEQAFDAWLAKQLEKPDPQLLEYAIVQLMGRIKDA